MKIKFLVDRDLGEESFRAGQVYDLPEPRASFWLGRRGVAVSQADAKAAEVEAEAAEAAEAKAAKAEAKADKAAAKAAEDEADELTKKGKGKR